MQRVRLPLVGLTVEAPTLFKLRTAAGITQNAVAQRAKISDYWYRLIEQGRKQPSRPVAEAIAEAIGCRLTDFCVSTEDVA